MRKFLGQKNADPGYRHCRSVLTTAVAPRGIAKVLGLDVKADAL